MDLDELLTPNRWRGKLCTVTQGLEEIADEQDRAKVAAAALHPRVPIANVVAAFAGLLTDEPPDEQAVRRHRNRKCKCR